jgi:transcriptional regulator with XRE-family HTH domain
MDPIPVKCLVPQHLRRIKKTQRWFAGKAGETEQQVSNYVNMVRLLGITKAKKWATILDCTIDELYLWKDVEDQGTED